MAQVLFLPSYADVLDQVLLAAAEHGATDVACRSDVDAGIVAGQVREYARATGRVVRCSPRGDRVQVRLVDRADGHPSRRAG